MHFFLAKKRPQKVTRANACFFWLAVLCYKHRRLNGLGSPFGIETLRAPRLALCGSWLNALGSPFGIETLL